MEPDPVAPEFSTCRVCGDAVPPTAKLCPTCGSGTPIREDQVGGLTGGRRRRFQFLKYARIAVVAAVALSLVVLLLQAAFTPAPVAADPLTQSSTRTVAPGHVDVISGDITGGDYIQGNYTVIDPPGAHLTLSVFNSSEFPKFLRNESADPMYTSPSSASTRIVFAALYTDTYYFVWQNEYPAGSGLDLTFYVSTTYETNVVIA